MPLPRHSPPLPSPSSPSSALHRARRQQQCRCQDTHLPSRPPPPPALHSIVREGNSKAEPFPPLPSTPPPALHSIVREGNSKAAAKTLQDLYAALNQAEPKNAELFCR